MVAGRDITFTYKDFSDRNRKNLAILDCIRRKSPISRTDIAKETGINIVSISNYILNYIKKDLVFESGLDVSSGGRRPELVKLNIESANVVGVDIGPEKLIVIVTDLGLNVKAKMVFSRPRGNMEEVLKNTVGALEKVFRESKITLAKIKLIGIGTSGVIDIYTGTIRDTDPERGRTKADFYTLARLIEEKFKIHTLVGNDATCAAFGELSLNPRADISEMLYIYSDIGCGIIINGDIYCGATGGAGEIQLLVNSDRQKQRAIEIASYGVKGADLGIVNEAKKLVDKGDATGILQLADNNRDQITKETIFSAAQQGDKVAKELLTNAAYWLGIRVAYLINVFNPQVVAIGGGMEKAGSIFMDALIDCVKIHTFEEAFNAVKILPSFLGEDAIALGAASLSIRELFIKA